MKGKQLTHGKKTAHRPGSGHFLQGRQGVTASRKDTVPSG